MQVTLSITRKNFKSVIFWACYILFFLFNVTLITDSYREYEDKAGNIFLVFTIVLGLLGLAIYFIGRAKKRRKAAITTESVERT